MSYRSELVQVAAVAVSAIEAHDAGRTLHSRTPGILWEIRQERKRQNQKWGSQDHKPDRWMIILMEEVGEAAEAILEEDL